jgi:hypothetical protein
MSGLWINQHKLITGKPCFCSKSPLHVPIKDLFYRVLVINLLLFPFSFEWYFEQKHNVQIKDAISSNKISVMQNYKLIKSDPKIYIKKKFLSNKFYSHIFKLK